MEKNLSKRVGNLRADFEDSISIGGSSEINNNNNNNDSTIVDVSTKIATQDDDYVLNMDNTSTSRAGRSSTPPGTFSQQHQQQQRFTRTHYLWMILFIMFSFWCIQVYRTGNCKVLLNEAKQNSQKETSRLRDEWSKDKLALSQQITSLNNENKKLQDRVDELSKAQLGTGGGRGGTDGTSTTCSGTAEAAAAAHTAVILFTHKREQYLSRALKSLLTFLPETGFDIYISQDGDDARISDVIESFISSNADKHPNSKLVHLKHNRDFSKGRPPPHQQHFEGYYAIAQHYGWAIDHVFSVHQRSSSPAYKYVILLEDDLEIAPDFYDYFESTAFLLDKDPSLMCVSAWNDNGMERFVSDPAALYRSDFFPGLGWMMTRRLWEMELRDKWPDSFWDDWLRGPAQRRGRACIRPEISRTFTFGEKGASSGQFYNQFLKNIQLNKIPVDFHKLDLSYLLRENYDPLFEKTVAEAVQISLSDLESKNFQKRDYKIVYQGGMHNGRPFEAAFDAIADRLGLMKEFKAGVPRTAYKGVVMFKYNLNRVFLVPDKPTYTYDNPEGKGDY